jgi:hypothetical protein
MSWSSNKKLVACSSDGYCSIISFANEEAHNVIGARFSNEMIENDELKQFYD